MSSNSELEAHTLAVEAWSADAWSTAIAEPPAAAEMANVYTPPLPITINYTGDAAYQSYFTNAAALWQLVFTSGASLYNGTTGMIIDASATYIDGPSNILGRAGPTDWRPGTFITSNGIMEFDSADLANMVTNGTLASVILHEMGHVIGIGSYWNMAGLVVNNGGYQYTGAGALAEYRVLANNAGATYVPVENGGGSGTAGVHWSESVFGNELMTGYISGASNPMSRMTLAGLRDLGYSVDLGVADPYWLASTPSQYRDDYAGNFNTTGTISAGMSKTGNVELGEDNDWYKATLVAGQTYIFQLRGSSSSLGTLADSYLNVRGTDYGIVTSDDDSGIGSESRAIYTAGQNGTYYIDASAYSNSTSQVGYTLSMQQMIYGSYSLNGDAQSDVLWRDLATGETGFYRNSGGGYTWISVGNVSRDYNIMGMGDFNGDGTADILWRSSQTNDTGYYAMNANGSYSWVDFGTLGGNYSILGVGDFNGDHRADILWRNLVNGDTGYYQMNGSSFTWRDFGNVTTYNVAGIGDFNGDGIDDVLWRNPTTGDVGYYQNAANGSYSWHDIGTVSTAYQIVGVGDFNADHIADILWRNTSNGDTGYYQMNGGVGYSWHGWGQIGSRWAVVGVGDYNGNGTTDVMWRDLATGETGYYQNNVNGSYNWVGYGTIAPRWDLT